MIECVDPATAVILEASAPVIEHVATPRATEYGVPVPRVTCTAPAPIVRVTPHSYLDEGKSPNRAKKSSRLKDDDDLLVNRCAPGSLHNSALSAV